MTARNHGCGVYAIVNTITWVYYVGSAADFQKRWTAHVTLLRGGRQKNRHLQASWKKHGEAAFVFVAVETTTPEERLAAEQRWIDAALTIGARVYNENPIARLPPSQAGALPWNKGRRGFKQTVPESGFSWARLTEADVYAIRAARAAGDDYTRIAARYGVDPATAKNAATGLTWAHVPGAVRDVPLKGMSVADAAKMLGVSETRVQRLIKRGELRAERIHQRLDIPRDAVEAVKEARRPQARGERHGMSKLTESKVREIRVAYGAGELQRNIAARFGVSQHAVQGAVTRKTWKHVA